MRRMTFAALSFFLLPAPLMTQPVPGRDLLRFPLGTMDRAVALGSGLGDGLGNPATVAMLDTGAMHVGISALQTSSQQGVTVQLGTVAVRLPRQIVFTTSFARASVSDLVRTETDPQSIGTEIPYATQLLSVGVARRIAGPISAGAALRYRRGELDLDKQGELGADVGLFANHLPLRDLSVGVATFLWRPGRSLEQHTAINMAADVRIAGSTITRELRAGYSSSAIVDWAREEFVFVHGRHGIWEGRGGLTRDVVHGAQPWRQRLGLTVYVAPYSVGIAREENGAGLEPIYQLTLAARLR
ncbi:MAG TPA: hypothetical protein VMM77_04345 [Gemmatimonadaceae bacterium]|nr:hypothetical protein [Gemmatimonadaceae bacterium]